MVALSDMVIAGIVVVGVITGCAMLFGLPQDVAYNLRIARQRRKATRIQRQKDKREAMASLERYNAGLGPVGEFRLIPGTVHGTLPKCLCEHWYIVHDTGGYQCQGSNGRCECVTYMGPDPMLSGLWSPSPKLAIEGAPSPVVSLTSMNLMDLMRLAKQISEELATRGVDTVTDWYASTQEAQRTLAGWDLADD